MGGDEVRRATTIPAPPHETIQTLARSRGWFVRCSLVRRTQQPPPAAEAAAQATPPDYFAEPHPEFAAALIVRHHVVVVVVRGFGATTSCLARRLNPS